MTTLTPTNPYTYMCILQKPWAQHELFADAETWVDAAVADTAKNNTACNPQWDFTSSSWINGKIYPSAVIFKNPADYMVFKIKFPQLIKF